MTGLLLRLLHANHLEGLQANKVGDLPSAIAEGHHGQVIPHLCAVLAVVQDSQALTGTGLDVALQRHGSKGRHPGLGWRCLQEAAVPPQHLLLAVPSPQLKHPVGVHYGVVRLARIGDDHGTGAGVEHAGQQLGLLAVGQRPCQSIEHPLGHRTKCVWRRRACYVVAWLHRCSGQLQRHYWVLGVQGDGGLDGGRWYELLRGQQGLGCGFGGEGRHHPGLRGSGLGNRLCEWFFGGLPYSRQSFQHSTRGLVSLPFNCLQLVGVPLGLAVPAVLQIAGGDSRDTGARGQARSAAGDDEGAGGATAVDEVEGAAGVAGGQDTYELGVEANQRELPPKLGDHALA
mmetsp:Transcript_39140/g.110853  ORF Transcript_39140/g.110853 Transcript_39140/m.110853 type:complete len:343 (+) Transcript_39140:534-1562(+)